MIRAFGWCNDSFDPHAPGRLCRGRERWLEGLPDTSTLRLHRTVLSGAVFSDDSARDAQRGFVYSGVMAGRLLAALFPGHSIYGFAEAGEPRTVPAHTLLEEDWVRPVLAGTAARPAVRWIAQARLDDVDDWMAGDNERDASTGPLADGFVVVKGSLTPALIDGIHLLVGFGDNDDRPARRYSPTGLVDLLGSATAVVLLHLDKHASTLSIYTREPLEADETLALSARVAEAFPVPFAIPPMLARWDRALYELRMKWDPSVDGEFPVPPADDAGGRWSSRRRRSDEVEPDALDAESPAVEDGEAEEE